MKYYYPAVFVKDDDKIGVSFPDISDCFTFGDNMADALFMASDAASMMIASFEDDGETIPVPSDIKTIKTDGVVSLVPVDTDAWRKQFDNRAVKKTLTIPSWLNKKAEKAGINFSQVLQDALRTILI